MSKTGKCIGHAPCPYCSAKVAEVKHDKNGNPYIVCFECPRPSQHFTLGDPHRIKALLGGGRFRPIEGMELPEWAKGAPAPAPAPTPAPAPAPAPAAEKKTVLG